MTAPFCLSLCPRSWPQSGPACWWGVWVPLQDLAQSPLCLLQKHEFSVDMTCEGCSNAVTRVLNKLGGVQFDIDLPNKKVCIDSEHSVDTLLETLGKTGKAVSYLGPK
uniref:Copper transport protein ATOX1 n=3 Tax=Sus scrofa TaxID=9823 RepID=A0A8D0IR62_PIG